MLKWILVFTFHLILLMGYNSFTTNINLGHSFAQNISNKSNTAKTNSWISKRDNLNISMSLNPPQPLADQNTKISFEIKKLNSTAASNLDHLIGRVVIVDSDGRLFKFGDQNVTNNKFSVNYIFPSNGSDRIILELYKDKTPFTIGSFNINIISSQAQQQNSNNFFTNLFKGL